MAEVERFRLLDPAAVTVTIETGITQFPVVLEHNAGHNIRVEVSEAGGAAPRVVVVPSGVEVTLGEVWR